MKIWEELSVGDNICYVVLDEDNVHKLLSNQLKIEHATINANEHIDGAYILKTDSDVLEEVIISIKEYFTQDGAALEIDDKALIIGTDTESFTKHLKKYLHLAN